MKELYNYYEGGKKREKLPFIQGIITASSGLENEVYFRIDSLPKKGRELNFSELLRLDVGEEVRVYYFKGDTYQNVVGIQILEKGKVKFQVTSSPNCYFE